MHYMDKAENAKSLQKEQQDRICTDIKVDVGLSCNKNDKNNPSNVITNL